MYSPIPFDNIGLDKNFVRECREEELNFIKTAFSKEEKIVVIKGVSGQGKSALAKQFLSEMGKNVYKISFLETEKIDRLIFLVRFVVDLHKDLFKSNGCLVEYCEKYLNDKNSGKSNDGQSIKNFEVDIIKKINKAEYLFLDNANNFDEDFLEELKKMDLTPNIIITTQDHQNILQKEGGGVLFLKGLNKQKALIVFAKYYGRDLKWEREKNFFNEIIWNICCGNTTSDSKVIEANIRFIQLIAELFKEQYNPKEQKPWELLQTYDFSEKKAEISRMKDKQGNKFIDKLKACIPELFNKFIEKLSDQEDRTFLLTMAIYEQTEISKDEINDILEKNKGLRNFTTSNTMFLMDNGSTISMHPIISEQIILMIESQDKLKPNLDSWLKITGAISKLGNYDFNKDKFSEVSDSVRIDGQALKDVTKITIPNGITEIGYETFKDCANLQSIEIPSSVTSIGENAFEGCSNLKEVNYKGAIASWCDMEFYNFNSNPLCNEAKLYIGNREEIKELVIPPEVTEIKNYAFYKCSNIQSVIFDAESKLEKIGKSGFSNCTYLQSINIPSSVQRIFDLAFYCCKKLKSVSFERTESQLECIEKGAFSQCAIECIELPSSLNYIGMNAFYECKKLKKITIFSNEITIRENAFQDCPIEEGNIPASVIEHIPKDKLERLFINGGTTIDSKALTKGENLKEINISSSVNYIYKRAFIDCVNLEILTFGSGSNLNELENGIFRNCPIIEATIPANLISYMPKKKLRKVTINSGEVIKCKAFHDCNNLQEIEMGSSILRIEKDAFLNCGNLQYKQEGGVKYLGNSENPYFALIEAENKEIESCNINSNTRIIADKAFEKCKIKDVYYQGHIESWCKIKFYFYSSNPLSNGARLYIDDRMVEDLRIPENVTEINDYTFNKCRSLNRVTICSTVKSIGIGAFYNCPKLKNIILQSPINLNQIKKRAFKTKGKRKDYKTTEGGVKYLGNSENPYFALIEAENKEIESCNINSNTRIIADCAFEDCLNLKSIEIPASVTSIGDDVFEGCSVFIKVQKSNNYYYSDANGNLFDKENGRRIDGKNKS